LSDALALEINSAVTERRTKVIRQLRQRASEALAAASQIVLSTAGPAELQAESVSCEAVGLTLYVLVTRTSDLLFNLESNTLVVATADTWQMRGVARILRQGERPDGLALASTPESEWCQLVEIRPTQMQLRPPHRRAETIDLW
jgi:hypothetical protein